MKIGFLGAGNMGGAIARAAVAAGYRDVLLCDKDEAKAKVKAKELGCAAGDAAKLSTCDMIFLGVKPQFLKGAMVELLAALGDARPLLVSMAAGVSLATLEALAPSFPIIRIMPNTPVGIGEGMVLYTKGTLASEDDAGAFCAVMAKSGAVYELSEGKIDAASALSGCGPAFVCLFLEALADGGVAAGLSRDEALLFARQTLLGTAALVKETGKHPAVLKDEVCSPGGSTIQGVRALEEGAFRATVMSAVLAALARTKELGKQ